MPRISANDARWIIQVLAHTFNDPAYATEAQPLRAIHNKLSLRFDRMDTKLRGKQRRTIGNRVSTINPSWVGQRHATIRASREGCVGVKATVVSSGIQIQCVSEAKSSMSDDVVSKNE